MVSNDMINSRQINAENEDYHSWDDFDLLTYVPVNTVKVIYKQGNHWALSYIYIKCCP